MLGHGGLRLALSFSLLPWSLRCAEGGFGLIFLFKQKYSMGKRENVPRDVMPWQGTAARCSLPTGAAWVYRAGPSPAYPSFGLMYLVRSFDK